MFDESTEMFKQALKKIPDNLLKLFESQFRAKPISLIEGGIIPEPVATSAATAAEAEGDALEEDAAMLDEDDSE